MLYCPSKRRLLSPIHEVCKAPAPTCQHEGPATPRAFVIALGGPATSWTLFGKGDFALDCTCRAQVTRAGVKLYRVPESPGKVRAQESPAQHQGC